MDATEPSKIGHHAFSRAEYLDGDNDIVSLEAFES